MPKKKTPKPVPPYLWVTMVHFGARLPSVERWTLIEVRDTGYKVLIRGYPKFVGPAQGRKFFTDEEKLWAYLKKFVETEREYAERRVAGYTEILGQMSRGDRTCIEITTVPDRQKTRPEQIKLK